MPATDSARPSGRSRLTRKGQVTIPKPIRDRLGLRTGDSVDFSLDQRGAVHLVRRAQARPIDKWLGYLARHAGEEPDTIVRRLRGE